MQRWAGGGGGDGWGLGKGRSKVSGGCAGFKWKVWGLAQGCRQIHEWEVGLEFGGEKGGKARRVSANFMTITFVFNFFFSVFFFPFYVIFFCHIFILFYFLQLI